MGGAFKSKKPKGPSAEEIRARQEAEVRTRKMQEEQMEESAQQESDIAEERYKLRKKAKGRGSLLSGGAQGIQDTMG